MSNAHQLLEDTLFEGGKTAPAGTAAAAPATTAGTATAIGNIIFEAAATGIE